jgi:homoserine dehydrogenase
LAAGINDSIEDIVQRINLMLIGFGNVGQAFVRLLLQKQAEYQRMRHLDIRLVGIVTGRHGMAYDAEGLPLAACLELAAQNKRLTPLHKGQICADPLEFIKTFPADIVLETSPTRLEHGQPAISYLKAALTTGKHIVTANKGPVVHAFDELQALAKAASRKFYFEATVMDGAPLFAMLRSGFPGAQITGFSGILNSCTNLLLERMSAGESLEDAVAYAQSIGIAETDPIGDIDGWDAAIKLAALLTIVMGIPTKPQEIQREGIGGLSPHHIAEAARQGKRWKLICTAERKGNEVAARVSPQMVSVDSPFYAVNGTNSFILVHSDVLPAVGLLECEPGPHTTAYGLLADVLNIAELEQ